MKFLSTSKDQPKDKPGLPKSKNLYISERRARTRDKALTKSAASLTELKLMEIPLYPSDPCGDTKPVAKRLAHQFRTLAGLLRASMEKLQETERVGPAAIVAINVTEAAALRLSHSQIKTHPASNN